MSIKGLFRVLLGTAPDCLCPWDAIYCERLSARAPVCVCALGMAKHKGNRKRCRPLKINAFILSHGFLPFHLFSLSLISSINNKLLYNIQVIVKMEEKVILNAGNKCSVFSKYIKKIKTTCIIALLDEMS